MLLALAAAILLQDRRRDLPAGAIFALCLLRFHLFLLLPVLLLTKRMWRFALGTLLALAVLFGISVAMNGLDWPAQYYQCILRNEVRLSNWSLLRVYPGLWWPVLVSTGVGIGYWALARRLSESWGLALCAMSRAPGRASGVPLLTRRWHCRRCYCLCGDSTRSNRGQLRHLRPRRYAAHKDTNKGRGLSCEGFYARGEARFVAGGSVLLNNSPLGRAVYDRKCRRESSLCALCILRRNQAADGAHLVTEAGLAAAIDRRAPFSDSDPLKRGNMIRHSTYKPTFTSF